MRLLHPVSEDEMVAVFLRGELGSSRYGERLLSVLKRDGRGLDERRGGLFMGFPRRIDWFRAALTPQDVLDILFIDWEWWLDLSLAIMLEPMPPSP